MSSEGALRGLLPLDVAVAESTEALDLPPLAPTEQAGLGPRCVDKRRREFTAGRGYAKAALDRLGVPDCAIPVGPRGSPVWPLGIVGSITHCAGYVAAAAGRADRVTAIGIDAEVLDLLPPGVQRRVTSSSERSALASLPPDTPWDRVLFSAKESVYKAWYPLTGRWLGFEDVVVEIDPVRGTFEAALLVRGADVPGGVLDRFEGRFRITESVVVTATLVVADSQQFDRRGS